MISEEKLIRKAKLGDKRSFGKLINLYQDQILFLAHDYIGNYEDAKDAAQEIFIKSFENLGSFNQSSKFKTWLYRIAINTCIDILRSRKNKKDNEVPINTEIIQNKFIQEENFAWDDQFMYALSTLSEKQHSAVILKYFHEKSTKEISEILECDINTVRIHLHRAMQKLKKIYNKPTKQ